MAPAPVMTLMTPAGSPMASAAAASSRMEKGVNSEGFSTIVQPAAREGPTFHAPTAMERKENGEGCQGGERAPTHPRA